MKNKYLSKGFELTKGKRTPYYLTLFIVSLVAFLDSFFRIGEKSGLLFSLIAIIIYTTQILANYTLEANSLRLAQGHADYNWKVSLNGLDTNPFRADAMVYVMSTIIQMVVGSILAMLWFGLSIGAIMLATSKETIVNILSGELISWDILTTIGWAGGITLFVGMIFLAYLSYRLSLIPQIIYQSDGTLGPLEVIKKAWKEQKGKVKDLFFLDLTYLYLPLLAIVLIGALLFYFNVGIAGIAPLLFIGGIWGIYIFVISPAIFVARSLIFLKD